MQRLRDAAEQAKKELSSASSTNISMQYLSMSENGPIHLDETLTRAQFQELTKDLLDRCKQPFLTVIKDAGISLSEIDHVVLVGGSTRMPAVSELVKELTGGREPNKGVNPDEVVALGASLQAGVLKGERKDILLIDVTPLSLGIETKGGLFTKLIERNTAIPTKRSEVFNREDNQPSVLIRSSERARDGPAQQGPRDVRVVGHCPGAARGSAGRVTFDIDASSIVHVTAKDRGTGKERDHHLGGSALSRTRSTAWSRTPGSTPPRTPSVAGRPRRATRRNSSSIRPRSSSPTAATRSAGSRARRCRLADLRPR